jgi:HAD superfamily hydrolase (TIGR01509 family)
MVPTSPAAKPHTSSGGEKRAARALRPGAKGASSPKSTDGVAAPAILRGLICEMAGVLYDATLWRREVVKLLSRLGVSACYPHFFDRWDREYLSDVQCGFRQFEEAFQAFLLSAGLSWGQIDEVEAASRIRRQEIDEGVRPLPGVPAAIGQLLGRGLTLAILADSASPACRLEFELGKLGLGGKFHCVLSSFDLEATKPAARCYHAAIEASGLPAEELAFVGCDREGLTGARACGLRTIAINGPSDVAADVRLTKFGELVEIARQWSESATVQGQA